MMTTSSPISSGHAARYYRHYRTENAKEYYVEGDVEGEWVGNGAAELGLSGGVSSKDFKTVLDGRHPRTGVQLVRGSSAANGKRAAGWDVTFAAPKSLSLLTLIGRDEQVLTAHDEATREAVRALEKLARGRVTGRKRGDLSENIVAALFRHETSRDLDPHLHTHSVFVNMTKNSDGKWVALDSTALFELQRYGTTIYRNALAERLLAAGYALRHGAQGSIEIDGISDEQIAHFSKRHEAIWAVLRRQGRDDPAAQQRVQRSTRRRKEHVNRADLAASWVSASQEIGLDPEALRRAGVKVLTRSEHGSTPPGTKDRTPSEERAREAIDYAIAHLTEREAVVLRSKIIEAALARRIGYVSERDAEQELERRTIRREVIPHRDDPQYVTTREMLTLERAILGHLRDARNAVAPIAAKPDFSAFFLSESQTAAAAAILGTTDRLVGIQGVAGAGKTYLLEAVNAEAERAGLIVRGFAPTTGAAEELAKSGIRAKTVAAHLASPGAAHGRELWVVDEASLLATRQLHRLLEHARAAWARVVLIGDIRQHAGVEAGSPFRLLLAAGINRAELTEIRRQRDRDLLEAVTHASMGHTRMAVAKLDEMGAVTEIRDALARHEAIADRFARQPEGTLVIAPSNKEREDLNRLIRYRFRNLGRLAGDEVRVATLRARDVTGVQRGVAAQYRIGDVVRYRRGSRLLHIAKDTYATVVAHDVALNRLTVCLPNSETREYDPQRLAGVDVFESETRTFAAGERIQFKAPLRSPAVPNGALGTIETLRPDGVATVRLDEREEPIEIDLAAARHLDYGYAVTSYSSQGKTVDKALVAMRTEHHKQLVNSAQTYVSISRARNQVEIFTDVADRLAHAASRDATKYSATDFQLDPGRDRLDLGY